MQEKIFDEETAYNTVCALRKEGRKIVFTNGCFDILHIGHIRFLQNAKELGGFLIVAMNSDSSIKKIKGRDRPIIPQEERSEVIAALGCVDLVFIFEDTNLDRILNLFKPEIYVKGGDYVLSPKDATPSRPAIVQSERNIVESYGGRIAIIPGFDNASTTNIITRIKKGNLQ